MFSHRSFLVIGGGAADIFSLINGGYEIQDFSYAFEQGTDKRGKATTRVFGGACHITLTQLPSNELIEWALNPRKYFNGFFVILDANNIPIQKVIFTNATCVNFGIDSTRQGTCYTTTKMVIYSENIVVGNGVDFNNEWNFE